MQAVTEKVFQSAMCALRFTKEPLDFAAVEAAFKAHISARKLVIFGMGASGPIAADLHHKLLRSSMDAMSLKVEKTWSISNTDKNSRQPTSLPAVNLF